MIHAVSVGTDNLTRSIAFYDAVLATLGIARLKQNEFEVGYGIPGESAMFFVNLPYNQEPTCFGNGVQITFAAKSREAVDLCHAKALELGGTDEGAPGERDYSPGYYGAYCRDEYGNKLHVAYVPGYAGAYVHLHLGARHERNGVS